MTKVSASLLGNMAFEMDMDGHKLITDAGPEIGGEDRGYRPKSLLLSALIGCTGVDVMTIIKTMRVSLDDMKIEVEANSVEEHPRIYDKIHMIYRIKADEKHHERIKRAVQLSQEKYCPVAATIRKASEITYEVVFE